MVINSLLLLPCYSYAILWWWLVERLEVFSWSQQCLCSHHSSFALWLVTAECTCQSSPPVMTSYWAIQTVTSQGPIERYKSSHYLVMSSISRTGGDNELRCRQYTQKRYTAGIQRVSVKNKGQCIHTIPLLYTINGGGGENKKGGGSPQQL